MKRLKIVYKLVLIFVMCFFGQSNATHIRAGEIVARQIGNLQYEFTVILYRNTEGVPMDTVQLFFGDNTSQKRWWTSVENLGNQTEKYTFKFTKTYAGVSSYKAYIIHRNRNEGISNINNSGIVNFYVETLIIPDFIGGSNVSPVLKIPPIDVATQRKTFTHNPGAWDADGDSLVYSFISPKWVSEDTAEVVPGFKPLTDPSFSSSNCTSDLKIDQKKGDITWETPCRPGLYNIAIKIEEYRNGRLIGYITRDMQIRVEQFDNDPPKLQIPADTCLTVGNPLSGTITGTDVATSQLTLTTYGGVYDVNPAAATRLQFPPNPQITPAKMFFTWNTSCVHVRQQPYDIQFKVEDLPFQRNKLSTIKTWSVTLLAPKPSDLKATTLNKSITISWKKYTCSNAAKMYIMRKECPSDSSRYDSCTTGYEATLGFKKLAEVRASDTSFVDDKDLKRGAVYCYRIFAVFPEPGKGQSKPSNELCITLSADVPIPFKVSVDTSGETSLTDGKIAVAWTSPKMIDSSRYPPPYEYELWRKGVISDGWNKIGGIFGFMDTTFLDTKLNTKEIQYRYFLKFFYGSNRTLRENSDTASSVFLRGFSKNKRNVLSWKVNAPWKNDGKYHYIWRFNDTTFVIIDSVFSTSNENSYVDAKFNNKPLENGKEYQYFVTTQGDYTCPDQITRVNIPALLRNNSQKISVIPSDTNRPCPPVVRISAANCNQRPIESKISWKPVLEVFCDSLVKEYRIYYVKDSTENYRLLKTLPISDTVYTDRDNSTPGGCYYLTSISTENRESNRSNVVCQNINTEDCNDYWYFELPNVFTPNQDGINDVFSPKPSPQFVASVSTTIMNRWGSKVFESNEVNFKWDGASTSDGLYYYACRLTFSNPNIAPIDYRGWVQLIR